MFAKLFTGPGSIRRLIGDVIGVVSIFGGFYVAAWALAGLGWL